MVWPWALRGLRNGIVTTRWPRRPDQYFESFTGSVRIDRSPERAPQRAAISEQAVLDRICPTGALSEMRNAGHSDVELDRGRCILCGACVAALPEVCSWAPGAGTARLTRGGLVDTPREDTDDDIREVRDRLAERVRRLRRSLHIRHIDCGSDGSDEWEVQALLNPVYDIHRLGVFFTASPRHADILLVTGNGTAGMMAPLRRTREAMPDPVVVIAAGTDAITGGLYRGGYTGGVGVAQVIDVDIWVPGSPPSPFSLLHAILLAVGGIPPDRTLAP